MQQDIKNLLQTVNELKKENQDMQERLKYLEGHPSSVASLPSVARCQRCSDKHSLEACPNKAFFAKYRPEMTGVGKMSVISRGITWKIFIPKNMDPVIVAVFDIEFSLMKPRALTFSDYQKYCDDDELSEFVSFLSWENMNDIEKNDPFLWHLLVVKEWTVKF